jgi:hypothetical protein
MKFQKLYEQEHSSSKKQLWYGQKRACNHLRELPAAKDRLRAKLHVTGCYMPANSRALATMAPQPTTSGFSSIQQRRCLPPGCMHLRSHLSK